MDCMFFSDTYFTSGFDDKIKKILSPDENFILVLHAVQWSCENDQVSFFVQLSGLVWQYFKILIYSIFWRYAGRYVFDYWCSKDMSIMWPNHLSYWHRPRCTKWSYFLITDTCGWVKCNLENGLCGQNYHIVSLSLHVCKNAVRPCHLTL